VPGPLRVRRSRAFVRWARERAIPLELGPGTDPEVLRPLDPLLAGRRIVFLGESNHFVHEKYAYRLLFLRWLHSRGWRVLGEELGWSDGWRVDRYLATGDEAELERVTAYGYRGCRRSDRDDEPTGVLAGILAHQPEAALRAEQVRFARALRRVGGMRFFGFDVDYEPGAGYEVLEALLGDRFRELGLARVPGESLGEEIARIDRALAASGEPQASDAGRSLRTLRESLDYVRMAHPAASYPALRPAMAHRERVMHEHVDHVLARLGGEEKLVLMGHNAHLAKADRRIRPPWGLRALRRGVGPGGGQVPCLGTHVCARRPGEVFAVWMLEDRGHDSSPLPGSDRTVHPAPGTLNAALARVGPAAFVLPTVSDQPRSGLLRCEVEVASMYGTRSRLRPVEQADALCFVREVSPLRESEA
jgi:erythromycin esterase-like protein